MKYKITAILLILTITTSAQYYNTKIQGCVSNNRIDLRWAPVNYDTWQAGNSKGYIVERYTIMRNGEILSHEEISSEYKKFGSVFKPAPLEDWEPYSDEKYAAIAAECIYGKDSNTLNLTPYVAYQIYQQKLQKFSFALYAADMSVDVAWLSGLAYTDKNISNNEKYLYKVYINDTILQDTAIVFLDASLPTPLYNIPKPLIKWGDKTAEISINLKVLDGAYTIYLIERSADGGKNFVPLSEIPIVNIVSANDRVSSFYRKDTLPDNATSFVYRVCGVDCFGRKSYSSNSDEGHGVIPLTATPYITYCETEKNNSVKLQWHFPDSLNNSINGFRVYKQSSPKSRFKMIFEGTNPKQRYFVDNIPSITNYYKVSAYNHERENLMSTVCYAALVDSTPPLPPTALEGVIDTSGIAILKWKANNELDLAGYRVYTANQKNDKEYSLLTPKLLTDTTFQHNVNLNTLTSEIYYQVRAVDVRDNHSAPSHTFVLVRPDTIAPLPPIIKQISKVQKYLSLQWICSSSDDVAKHFLLRKEPKSVSYDTIATFSDTSQMFVDKTVNLGQDYVYAILAVDHSGNYSALSSLYYHAEITVADKVKLKFRNRIDGCHVSWIVESKNDISEYIVFKAENDEPLREIAKTFVPNYLDKNVVVGKKYTYAVKLIYSDGSESGLYK